MQTNTPRFKLAQSGSVEEKIDVLVSKESSSFSVSKNILGASQSAQLALPMTVDRSDWMEAASTRLFIRDLDLLLSFPY